MSTVIDILKNTEAQLFKQTGKIYRLSVDFALPEYTEKGIGEMCKIWGVNEMYLMQKLKSEPLITMRFIVMLFLRDCCKLTFKAIGRYYDCDHATVINAVKKSRGYRWAKDEKFYLYYHPVKHLFDEKI